MTFSYSQIALRNFSWTSQIKRAGLCSRLPTCSVIFLRYRMILCFVYSLTVCIAFPGVVGYVSRGCGAKAPECFRLSDSVNVPFLDQGVCRVTLKCQLHKHWEFTQVHIPALWSIVGYLYSMASTLAFSSHRKSPPEFVFCKMYNSSISAGTKVPGPLTSSRTAAVSAAIS